MNKKKTIIYSIRNYQNPKIYIGATQTSTSQAFSQHKSIYRKGGKLDNPLYKAFDDLDISHFYIQQEGECFCKNKEDINKILGEYYIKYDTLKNGYNSLYRPRIKRGGEPTQSVSQEQQATSEETTTPPEEEQTETKEDKADVRQDDNSKHNHKETQYEDLTETKEDKQQQAEEATEPKEDAEVQHIDPIDQAVSTEDEEVQHIDPIDQAVSTEDEEVQHIDPIDQTVQTEDAKAQEADPIDQTVQTKDAEVQQVDQTDQADSTIRINDKDTQHAEQVTQAIKHARSQLDNLIEVIENKEQTREILPSSPRIRGEDTQQNKDDDLITLLKEVEEAFNRVDEEFDKMNMNTHTLKPTNKKISKFNTFF